MCHSCRPYVVCRGYGEIHGRLDKSGDGLIDFEEFIVFMQNQLSASGTSKADVLEAFKVLAAAGEPAAPKSEDGAEADQPAMIKKSKIEVNFPEHNDQLEEPTMY